MDNSTVLQNCLLSNFYNLITVRLDDSNYVLWKFLVETMFSGCGLIRYIDGSFRRPPQYIVIEEGGVTSDMTKEYMDWVQNDSAVMSILAATLSSDALSFIVGSKTSREIWCRLKKRYVDDSVYNIMNLKASLYSIQKGSDSIDKYLLRVKSICDQLAMMEVYMADEDIVDSVLHGLPSEFATIKTIIRIKALSSSVSTEELRSLLLIAESEIEQTMKSMLERFKTEMMAHGDSFSRYAPAPTYVTDAKYDGGIQYNFGAFDYGITQQNGITQQRHSFRQNGGLMQQNGFPHQNGNFSPHVSYTNSDNYSQQSYSDNNGKNNNSRSHISNNKSYNTNQSYSSSVVCQSCEKPGTFMQQNVNCVGMQVLYGGSQVQGYSQISVTREDDNGSDSQSETDIENTQNFSQDEYVSTSEEKQEEVVSKEDSKEKVDSESENGDEGNQLEKFVEESSDEKDSLPFELCLPDEDNFITVVEYKDMVERNQVKADGVSLSAAVDSSSKPMDTKIGIKDANFSQVHKSEAINVFSDESSSSSLSNDMYMPHNANDVRWEAIQAVRDHDRMLGLNQFKLLNRHLMNCRQACESTNLWQSLPLISPGWKHILCCNLVLGDPSTSLRGDVKSVSVKC